MESDTDFTIRQSKKGKITNNLKPTIPLGQHPDDEFYDMTHPNRGMALIFNHQIFDDPLYKERKGTEYDKVAMEGMLKKLGFHVETRQDLCLDDIREMLYVVSRMDHSKSDCLVVAVMTHGRRQGRLACRDTEYTTDELIGAFDGRRCPSLAGKPKLFFIQACRGDKLDSGVKIERDSRGNESHIYTIPTTADVLVMYATVEGYSAWRDQTKGSWFIQTLVKKLEEHVHQRDILSILTMVNREVAFGHQSSHALEEYDKKKEMCSIVSMLTRELYFR